MKITVLMSVYNGEKYLKESIESILNQTYREFEFLIIDDGSTDESLNIIKSYNDKRIKIIENIQNKGLIYSLNLGIKNAQGDYIVRMDSDDICLNTRLEKQLEYMERNENIGILGSRYYFLEEKKIKKNKEVLDSESIKAGLLFRTVLAHPTVMIRKKIFEKNLNIYDEKFSGCEDYKLWTEIIDKEIIEIYPEYLLNYRVVENGITQSLNKNRSEKKKKLYKIYNRQLQKIGFLPTENELKIHFDIIHNKEEIIKLQDVIRYFKKIEEYNKKSQYVDCKKLKIELSGNFIRLIKNRKKYFFKNINQILKSKYFWNGIFYNIYRVMS